MNWSVAIFGHYKPRYELRETGSGKVVGFFVERPFDFDVLKYTVYEYDKDACDRRAVPGDIIAYRPLSDADKWTPHERKRFLIVTLENVEREQFGAICEPYIDTSSIIYPKEYPDERIELLYARHHKKRRMQVPLEILTSLGVDIKRMLDTGDCYTPSIRAINKCECFDKMKNRPVVELDGLNPIKPVLYGG